VSHSEPAGVRCSSGDHARERPARVVGTWGNGAGGGMGNGWWWVQGNGWFGAGKNQGRTKEELKEELGKNQGRNVS